MGRHRRRRPLAALGKAQTERVRRWIALVRAGNYGRAGRIVLYLSEVTVAAVLREVLAWLLHGL